ncbi:amidase [Cupriavidus gilardii]|uniref:amidase n=1 Tax=Cupriavidus gilardii TaxID=82541 RepID=UPI001FD5D6AD|nr:amidase family protein [Cupriavidus gilardii]MCT9074450.1 amidase family protein [Cupriavidus gilardii]
MSDRSADERAATADPAAVSEMAPVSDVFELPIAELARRMDAGTLTAEQLMAGHLARIEAFDRAGPSINAISRLHPDALREAARLDRERQRHGARSPLHGIPMVVKDNIDTTGLPTTAGCAALHDALPASDAPVVARLRAAGAIVLGKANMSELAASNGRFGYSSANGLTLNPYRLSRNASGSSSGTGAAVAAGFAVFGLGTDSFGSVRGPACVHALVGFRPTHGLLESDGVLPLAQSFDTVGPLTRSVDDAALVLAALAPQAGFGRTDDRLAGRRLGIVMDFNGTNDEIDALFSQACVDLVAAGASIVPVALPADARHLYERVLGDIARSEWAVQLDRYLGAMPSPCPRDTAALLARIDALEGDAQGGDAQGGDAQGGDTSRAGGRFADASRRSPNPVTIAALRHALATRNEPPRRGLSAARAFGAALAGLMQSNGCAALVFPTLACPASPRFDRDDPTYRCRASNPLAAMHMASAAGFPEISVPMGWTEAGVPAGLSLLGRAGDDRLLLGIARDYEAATRHRRPPGLG